MVERRRWWSLLATVMAVTAMTLPGCADGEKEPKTEPTQSEEIPNTVTYVGKVDSTSANIGLVVKGDRLAGFVCQDAKASLRLDAVPLDAVPLEEGTGELLHDAIAVGTVSVTDDEAVGTVDFEGSKRKFTAEPATGEAGVYRKAAENPGQPWDGWVVLNDGSHTGTSKSKPSTGRPWIDPDSQP